MWVMHILYEISEIFVRESQEFTVDSYRDVRGCKSYACVQLSITFIFVVLPPMIVSHLKLYS